MKHLTNEQIEKMAAVIVMLFSNNLNMDLGTIREMFFSYVATEELITEGTEEWPEMLIDNYNGGGYKATIGGAKKIYDDLLSDYNEKMIRMELQD